jgi:hypothetical protein
MSTPAALAVNQVADKIPKWIRIIKQQEINICFIEISSSEIDIHQKSCFARDTARPAVPKFLGNGHHKASQNVQVPR